MAMLERASSDDTAAAWEETVLDRFEAIARRFPEKLAVADATASYTYAALAALADDIAAAVAEATGDRPGPVAVLMPSEARYFAAMFAAFATGRGYVPLDINHPRERNLLIAEQSGAAAIVVAGAGASRISDLFDDDMAVVDIDALPHRANDWKRPPLKSGNLATIIYTSGSTGIPKGVYYDHGGLFRSHDIHVAALGLGPDDRVGMIFSPSVVAALRNALCAFMSGASLHVLSPRSLGAEGFARALDSEAITVVSVSPTLFRRLTEAVASANDPPRFASMRQLTLTSEPSDWSDVETFRTLFPPTATLVSRLASTECLSSLNWSVDDRFRGSDPRLPLGHPTPGIEVTLVDEDGRPVAHGAVGEIAVSGDHIAMGYWRAPDETAKSFTQNPENPERRSFRTGDFARLGAHGLYEFAGRRDAQLNLRGHRIEITEIEATLRDLDGIKDGGIVVRRGATGEPRALVAYVELDAGVRGLLPRHLQAMLGRRLPSYMVPAQVTILEALPRLPSFKIDRQRLEALDAERAHDKNGAEDDALSGKLIDIFESVIGIAGATPDDNVASLGGDSLQAVEIIAAIQSAFGVAFDEDEFAAADSIRELARRIGRPTRP